FGFAYGATRGVAEQEIAARIVGQEDRALLRKAGSQFFLALQIPSIVMPIAAAALAAVFGVQKLMFAAAASILASVVPFFFVQFRQERALPEEGAGTEERLPLKDYLPFLYMRFVHLSLWSIFGLTVAVQFFQDQAFFGQLTGLYATGGIVA